MYASYATIDAWLVQAEAAGTTAVLTVDLAWVLGLDKSALTRLARRGELGPYERVSGRFYRVGLCGVRDFVERYRCAFSEWVSLQDACRLSGAKSSTLLLWLDHGLIRGGRDMHGRVHIDPASLGTIREHARWTSQPEEVVLQGVAYYSLGRLARALSARAGLHPQSAEFRREYRRNYAMFYRWLTETDLKDRVRRVGRRRALYMPWSLYDELVNLVRPQQAAALIGESPHMLHYWARRGRIATVKLGGTQKMIPRAELEDFLEYRRACRRRRAASTPAAAAGGRAEEDVAEPARQPKAAIETTPA